MLFPVVFDVLDDLADGVDRGVSFGGEADPFGALVAVVGLARLQPERVNVGRPLVAAVAST